MTIVILYLRRIYSVVFVIIVYFNVILHISFLNNHKTIYIYIYIYISACLCSVMLYKQNAHIYLHDVSKTISMQTPHISPRLHDAGIRNKFAMKHNPLPVECIIWCLYTISCVHAWFVCSKTNPYNTLYSFSVLHSNENKEKPNQHVVRIVYLNVAQICLWQLGMQHSAHYFLKIRSICIYIYRYIYIILTNAQHL